MRTFLISYDLGVPETHASYVAVIKCIKSLGSLWAHPLQSVWIVRNNKNASQIRSEIQSVLDRNDRLIVVELSGNWGTYNISKEVTDWMHNNI